MSTLYFNPKQKFWSISALSLLCLHYPIIADNFISCVLKEKKKQKQNKRHLGYLIKILYLTKGLLTEMKSGLNDRIWKLVPRDCTAGSLYLSYSGRDEGRKWWLQQPIKSWQVWKMGFPVAVLLWRVHLGTSLPPHTPKWAKCNASCSPDSNWCIKALKAEIWAPELYCIQLHQLLIS